MTKLDFTSEITVEVLRVSFPRELTLEEQNDFNEWIKYKAAEMGLGTFYEHYYNLDDFENAIEVKYKSTLIKLT